MAERFRFGQQGEPMLATHLILLVSLARQTPCAPVVPSKQDVRVYDCGGTKVGGFVPPATTVIAAEAQVREFVWRHFRSKRQGFISLVRYSKEGDVSKITYYVRPRDNGAWTVQWFGEDHHVNRKAGGLLPAASFHGTASSIERLTVTPSGNEEVLPENVEVPNRDYRLRFRDPAGRVLQEL